MRRQRQWTQYSSSGVGANVDELSNLFDGNIIDKATNTKNIKCELIDKSFKQPILPSSSDNVVKKEEKDSLKVYIIKKSGYYVTRIWVKNPYMQLNKFDSPEYGKNFYNPVDLLKKADSKYNLSKKLYYS